MKIQRDLAHTNDPESFSVMLKLAYYDTIDLVRGEASSALTEYDCAYEERVWTWWESKYGIGTWLFSTFWTINNLHSETSQA